MTMILLVVGPVGPVGAVDKADFERDQRDAYKLVDEQVQLETGADLEIDLGDMDVWVKKGSGKTIKVEAWVKARDEERAQDYFDERIRMKVKSSDQRVRITTRTSNNYWGWRHSHHERSWTIITVPENINAKIMTVDGGVLVDALNGEIEIETKDGDINVDKLSGPSLEIDTTDGDIELQSIEGDEVFIISTDGDVEATSIKGKEVRIASTDGDIRIERIEGDDITVKTSDGDVDIGASGSELMVRCTDGDMRVQLFSQMTVDLDAYDGDIDLRLPIRMGAELDLRGEDVRVGGGISVKGQVTDRRIVGSINDGGPTVRAKTHEGTIALRADA